MNKIITTAIVLSICMGAMAQSQTTQYPNFTGPVMGQAEFTRDAQLSQVLTNVKQSANFTTLWSEDFANGIPAGWTNQGFQENSSGTLIPNANCRWEFRGPQTTPDNTVGSRGNFTTNLVIQSNTPDNFVIFDSDYLDNGGTSSLGSGSVPAPHVGMLITDTIDLSNHNIVELSFYTYARKFVGEFEVAFTTDGGATFSTPVQVFPNLAINAGTSVNEVVTINVSPYIGGEANAQIAFIFDGSALNNSNPNGDGYYFWQLDDIKINIPPPHRLSFAPLNSAGSLTAMRTDGSANNPHEGHSIPSEVKPIQFTGSLTNTGQATQHNVRLKAEIYQNGAYYQTLSSGAIASLAPGDTLPGDSLLTMATSLTQKADYQVAFYASSDSISKADNDWTENPDTLTITTNDTVYSLDFNQFDNYFGNNSGVEAAGIKIDLKTAQVLKGIQVNISSLTDSQGVFVATVYDTAGFTFGTSSTGPTGPIVSQVFNINASHVNNQSMYMQFSSPLSLAADAYYVVLDLLPSSSNNVIRIANDQSVAQGESSILRHSSGGWFSAFVNSLTFNAPHIRPVFEAGIDVSFNIVHESCPGQSDGSITATVNTPGTHTLSWSSGHNGNLADSLSAGNYQLTVYNAFDTTTFHLTVNTIGDSVLISGLVQNEACLNSNNGSISVSATGHGPFSYLWNTGDTTASISGLSPGVYTVTATDSNGCFQNESFTVAPGSGTISKPVLSISDSIEICLGNNLSLSLNNSYSNYLWSDGSTTSTLSVSQSGHYFVKVDNGSSCFDYSDTLFVEVAEPYEDLEICMVTLDLSTMNNVVYFSNPLLASIDSINLYSFDGQSYYYNATAADSGIIVSDSYPFTVSIDERSYVLGITDTCGNRSGFSPIHTSMALTVSGNGFGGADLSWTAYGGLGVDWYRIYKASADLSSIILLDSVAASSQSYTEHNAADTGFYYLVEAVFHHNPSCGNSQFQGSITANFYNPMSLNPLSIEQFQLYPNPTLGQVSIVNSSEAHCKAEIRDLSGKRLRLINLKPGKNHYHIGDLSMGVYLIHIEGIKSDLRLIRR